MNRTTAPPLETFDGPTPAGWRALTDPTGAPDPAPPTGTNRRDLAVGLAAFTVIVLVCTTGIGVGLAIGARVLRATFGGAS